MDYSGKIAVLMLKYSLMHKTRGKLPMISVYPSIMVAIAPQRKQKQELEMNTISFGYDSPILDLAKHCAYCHATMLDSPYKTAKQMLTMDSTQFKKKLQKYQKAMSLSGLNKAETEIINDLIKLASQQGGKNGQALLDYYIKNKNVRRPQKEARINTASIVKTLKECSSGFSEKFSKKALQLANSADNLRGYQLNRALFELGEEVKASGEGVPDAFRSLYYYAERRCIEDKKVSIWQNRKPIALLKTLLRPLTETLEHVKPHSKEGADETSNYLTVCASCNESRENKPFTEIVKDSKVVENIKASLIEIKDAIKKLLNPSSELQTYINDITETIKKESEGQLEIIV